MLPPPTLDFTIPSIQDNLVLCCRIYHPACLAPTSVSHLEEWQKKAAIVAHPYAPLGGCMDDPVVSIIASLLLNQGFIVGTFNFRGAGTSKGRTSWQAKSEQQDYVSFIGFMVYYLHQLSPPNIPLDIPKFARSDPELRDLSPIPSQVLPPPRMRDLHSLDLSSANHNPNLPSIAIDREATPDGSSNPLLLLAGYSYGALITTLLPPILTSLLAPFQTPTPGSPYAEIRLRSSSLASSQNAYIKTTISSLLSAYNHTHRRGWGLYADALTSPKTRKASGGVRMGGEEDLRRASHESPRGRSSFAIEAEDIVRKSVDRVRSITKHHPKSDKEKRSSPKRTNTQGSVSSQRSFGAASVFSNETDDGSPKAEKEEVQVCKPIPGIGTDFRTAYLLVSPLQGLVHNLATMFSAKFCIEHETKLKVDPTLAVFGDDDVFVSIKKLRTWSERLAETRNGKGDSQFRYVEVSGAGHFWHNRGTIRILQDEIKAFVKAL
ncbi:uncharacterized protein PAC_05922 [Phialocephala subalpina]|uniref:Uncharacterized protein n=1 Tax=Phialocephala subalpina TaxID=576137 RepID=A0A1L7WTC9_9HELO|nr:uncharacterized protein PAC_05922 [Phialocephala subalpina]